MTAEIEERPFSRNEIVADGIVHAIGLLAAVVGGSTPGTPENVFHIIGTPPGVGPEPIL